MSKKTKLLIDLTMTEKKSEENQANVKSTVELDGKGKDLVLAFESIVSRNPGLQEIVMEVAFRIADKKINSILG